MGCKILYFICNVLLIVAYVMAQVFTKGSIQDMDVAPEDADEQAGYQLANTEDNTKAE